ncbi:MAG: hypothetical protein N3D11_10225 [Candidatus Sumerlaeia bacterium]|nr:hypothetical protein [Candidatus Sumerlaeia bacterium]
MKSIQRFWMLGLTSPLIYLIICAVVNRSVFAHRSQAGFWPLETKTYQFLLAGLAVAAVCTFPLLWRLKTKWAMRAPEVEGVENTLLDSPRGRRFLVLFMVCDTVAVTGLILFLIQGQMSAMLLFGILGLVNYAAAYPGERKPPEE